MRITQALSLSASSALPVEDGFLHPSELFPSHRSLGRGDRCPCPTPPTYLPSQGLFYISSKLISVRVPTLMDGHSQALSRPHERANFGSPLPIHMASDAGKRFLQCLEAGVGNLAGNSYPSNKRGTGWGEEWNS